MPRAAWVVPPGEVTWRRSSAGSSPLRASSAAAPVSVERASLAASSALRPLAAAAASRASMKA